LVGPISGLAWSSRAGPAKEAYDTTVCGLPTLRADTACDHERAFSWALEPPWWPIDEAGVFGGGADPKPPSPAGGPAPQAPPARRNCMMPVLFP